MNQGPRRGCALLHAPRTHTHTMQRTTHPHEQKREEAAPVNPMLLGFFIFVVVGSSLFQIIRTAQSGPIF